MADDIRTCGDIDERLPPYVDGEAPPAAREAVAPRVRRCLSSDGRVAHMMYTWRGEPLSVYVLQAEAGHDAASHLMGAQEVIWRAHHRTYAVVSSDASRDLTPILDYIKGHVQ